MRCVWYAAFGTLAEVYTFDMIRLCQTLATDVALRMTAHVQMYQGCDAAYSGSTSKVKRGASVL